MRRRTKLGVGALGAALLVACVGGSGDLPDEAGYYENRPGRFESPGKRREAPSDEREDPPISTETPGLSGVELSPAQGIGGGISARALDCTGKYDCLTRTNGRSDDDDVTMREVNGVCTIDGTVVLASNGQVLVAGRVLGSWSGGGDTFSFSLSLDNRTVDGTCHKRTTETAQPTSSGDSPR